MTNKILALLSSENQSNRDLAYQLAISQNIDICKLIDIAAKKFMYNVFSKAVTKHLKVRQKIHYTFVINGYGVSFKIGIETIHAYEHRNGYKYSIFDGIKEIYKPGDLKWSWFRKIVLNQINEIKNNL
jgi:hypothetical protein